MFLCLQTFWSSADDNSLASARLSTAIAKKTFRSVSRVVKENPEYFVRKSLRITIKVNIRNVKVDVDLGYNSRRGLQ